MGDLATKPPVVYRPAPIPHCKVCDNDRWTRLFRERTGGVIAVMGWCGCFNAQESLYAYREWEAVPSSDKLYDNVPKVDAWETRYGDRTVIQTWKADCQYCGMPILSTARMGKTLDGFVYWRTGAALCGCVKPTYGEIQQGWETLKSREGIRQMLYGKDVQPETSEPEKIGEVMGNE